MFKKKKCSWTDFRSSEKRPEKSWEHVLFRKLSLSMLWRCCLDQMECRWMRMLHFWRTVLHNEVQWLDVLPSWCSITLASTIVNTCAKTLTLTLVQKVIFYGTRIKTNYDYSYSSHIHGWGIGSVEASVILISRKPKFYSKDMHACKPWWNESASHCKLTWDDTSQTGAQVIAS